MENDEQGNHLLSCSGNQINIMHWKVPRNWPRRALQQPRRACTGQFPPPPKTWYIHNNMTWYIHSKSFCMDTWKWLKNKTNTLSGPHVGSRNHQRGGCRCCQPISWQPKTNLYAWAKNGSAIACELTVIIGGGLALAANPQWNALVYMSKNLLSWLVN